MPDGPGMGVGRVTRLLLGRNNVVTNSSWHDNTGFHFLSRDMTTAPVSTDAPGPSSVTGGGYGTIRPLPSAITPPLETV